MVARHWLTNPALIFVAIALACASAPPASRPSSNAAAPAVTPAPDTAPDWSAQPAVVANEDDRPVLYGVGQSSGIAQPDLARLSAERRAKEEVARVLRLLLEDAGDAWPESRTVDDALAAAQAAVLTKARIVDYWTSPTANQSYARARLEVSAVLASIDEQTKLDDPTKAQMTTRIRAMVRRSIARSE